ncbi:MAG TPA: Cpe/LpqF family protein [Thermoanaerobaculia bacterium]|nr:Cpe/LpqF family protein [Thermoanaerobaculia bacterium]
MVRLAFRIVSTAAFALALLLVLPLGAEEKAAPLTPPAAVTLPKTPAGEALAVWLDEINSGDENRLTRYIAATFGPELLSRLPVDALKAFHLQTHAEGGKLTAVRIKAERPEKIMVLAQGEKGKQYDVTLAVQEAAPHLVTALRLVPANPEPPPPQPRPSEPVAPPPTGTR